jgi:hypothetical protein
MLRAQAPIDTTSTTSDSFRQQLNTNASPKKVVAQLKILGSP